MRTVREAVLVSGVKMGYACQGAFRREDTGVARGPFAWCGSSPFAIASISYSPSGVGLSQEGQPK